MTPGKDEPKTGAESQAGSRYKDVEYLQFKPSPAVRWTMAALGILSWPLIVPLALFSRLSDIIFRTCAEALSLVPYFPGVILRHEFYRFALKRCGRNVVIEFGAVFLYRASTVGNNVLIGRYSIVHEYDIGNYVLIGERCTLLSGSRQHRHERRDLPMALQGGERRRIRIADDCWIGSHSVIMDDIGAGSIVAAASVVNRPVEPATIVAGAPAQLIRARSSG